MPDWAALRVELDQQAALLPGAEGEYRRGHLSLLFGDWAQGWRQFEARLQIPGRAMPGRPFPQPLWTGEPFEGRTLLLTWEQGFGDTLMCLRFAPWVKALGGRVVAEVQEPLADLAATCSGLDAVVPYGAELPPFDLQASLLSLPAALRLTPAMLPGPVPYLDVPAHVPNRAWIAEALAPSTGRLRVGLAWAGNACHVRDRERSIPADHFLALKDWPNVAWHALQLETEVLPALPGICSLGPLLSSFSDTAYALSGMDLVITVDTALAHLAGALGIPTWLLLPYVPDWRWLLGRSDSPWYPSLRLFRQGSPGDWPSAFAEMNRLVLEPT